VLFSELSASLTRLGLKVITTPVRSPQANSLCERLVGTLRRECLDWVIPLSERHLRKVLASWMVHYNRGRPHSSLGPGVPDQRPVFRALQRRRHRFDRRVSIVARPVLNGLHNEYRVIHPRRLSVEDFCGPQVPAVNATAHPTAAWTLQQLRESIPSDHGYRFIIHDHDAIFSSESDVSMTRLGLKVITTPLRSPQANSLCERLIGTLLSVWIGLSR